MAMSEEELSTLKRAGLQKLAKLHGIKANRKVSKLNLSFRACNCVFDEVKAEDEVIYTSVNYQDNL